MDPSNLQKLGYDEVSAAKILRDSALIGFPLNVPIAEELRATATAPT